MIAQQPVATSIFYVMGVSGSGKTTIGKGLAQALQIPFFDGDDYHSEQNVEKMAAGTPLTDTDRLGWLEALNALAKTQLQHGAVIVCSALKERYRELLAKGIEDRVVWVFLKGSFEEIQQRMQQRSGHFMPPTLLKSQFEALEEPAVSVTISINQTPQAMVDEIIATIKTTQK
ncbi:gluconokinase [Arenibacter sp. GZD96]|uniref:gluconokinase n=1 Tax=Aurantibrevibacter litoralis TaxID=3106030 RepID=UPI002AFEA4E4|nr:gluconokinase [Arenibacter sp. GZD-96]MEA1786356.1 gluconokinase [Arenibacter sp. GZD-96]